MRLEDFTVKRQLGKGSFGRVYLAERASTGELHAMKAIRKDRLIDQNFIKATLLEKKIMFEIDHPFICGMDYFFQTQERLYFIMPYIKGGELFQILRQRQRLPESIVRFYGTQVVIAIGKLHERNILHRDLKLENVMLSENGYIKLIDFGMSRTLNTNSLADTFVGTPEYQAPEMLNTGQYDKAIDWWAVGVLLFELLVGKSPFHDRSAYKIKERIKHKYKLPDWPSPMECPYSQQFRDLVSKLLQKTPSNRLGSQGGAD